MTDKYYVGQVVIVNGKPMNITGAYTERGKQIFDSVKRKLIEAAMESKPRVMLVERDIVEHLKEMIRGEKEHLDLLAQINERLSIAVGVKLSEMEWLSLIPKEPLQPLMLEPPKEVKPYNQRGLKNGKRKRNPNRF